MVKGDNGDEIDIELLGGDPSHWQSNMFAPQPSETHPLYGVFGKRHMFPSISTTRRHRRGYIENFHTYTIEWSPTFIKWSVDGKLARSLNKGKYREFRFVYWDRETNYGWWIEDTMHNGLLHFPSYPSRIQLGIWDASGTKSTAHWAKGPVDWSKAPKQTRAILRRISVS